MRYEDRREAKMPSKRAMHSIQVLRGLAALLVVFARLHWTDRKYFPHGFAPDVLGNSGAAGVDLFFIISGFVMVFVSRDSFGRNGAALQFLQNRILRIYPIYWIYSLAALAVFIAMPQWVNAHSGNKVNIIASFALFPVDTSPLLLQAWSLIYEVFFYLVFSALLATSSKKLFPACLVTWGCLTLIGYWLTDIKTASPVVLVMTNPLVLEFILGCLAAVLHTSMSRLGSAVVLSVSVFLILTAFLFANNYIVNIKLFADGYFSDQWQWRTILYGIPFFMLVLGITSFEYFHVWRMPRLFETLGDASYSLYLSHILVLSAVSRLWIRFAPPHWNSVLGSITCLFSAIVAALVGYRFIENPLNAAVRSIGYRTQVRAIANKVR